MGSAIRDLDRTRDAIAGVRRIPSGKAADDRADVNRIAKRRFIDAELFEPTEETLPRGVREGTAILDFMRTRRLSDEHDPGVRNGTGHRMTENIWACAA